MLTWTDEAIRMFRNRTIGLRNARDVHALIDRIDARPELERKLEDLEGESLRQELQILAMTLLEAH